MTESSVNNVGDRSQTSPTLLARVRRNESEAWQLMVDLYAPLIYARCRFRWNMTEDIAENIGQEVFIAVSRKLKEFDRRRTGSFRAWLRVITDNKCRDFLSKNRAAEAKGGIDAIAQLADVVKDAELEKSECHQPNERELVMRQAMISVKSEFSDRDWLIFWRVTVDECSRKQIAEETQVSDNVVYLAYSRIRKRLRKIYQDLIDDDILIDEIEKE